MNIFGGMLLSLLKSYVAKLATQEFAHYVLKEVVFAIVKSTKTKEDDKWAEKIIAVIEGKDLEK